MSARVTTPNNNSLLPLSPTTTAPKDEEAFVNDLNVRLAAVQAEVERLEDINNASFLSSNHHHENVIKPIRREYLDASFEKRLRTVDGADTIIINMPTSAHVDVDVEGSAAKVMPAKLTPVYFPAAPSGTPYTSLEKTPLDIFSHAHIHTSSDLELGLQAYNRIAPPTITSANTSAKGQGQRKASRWVAYVAASMFMGGVVVGSVVGLVYYTTKQHDARN
ncbi:hypothetical protein B9479_007475 [Cryptococcus floricola]|uniref:Uncharacterized protein n=1 Tax=Cryptococcus floricola TaxID=2591691 RepID=A0A5D3AQH6_9TREE|nr:hypothetical protein B9479_007475 [Cryptococcus floricola]